MTPVFGILVRALIWFQREHIESYALNTWKLDILDIIDTCSRILFYCKDLDILPPKLNLRNLKKGVQKFHSKFVLSPADKAAN